MTASSALALLRAERHISASALTTYLTCPAAYRFRYILQLKPTHRPGPLAFGGAVHEALAQFYIALRDKKPEPSLEAIQAAFSAALKRSFAESPPVLLDNDQTEDSLLETGTSLLKVFHEAAPRPYRVVGVEEPFSVEIHDPETGEVPPVKLVGAFDVVAREENGQYVIIEHKTAGKRWAEDRLANDNQVTAYTLAAPSMGLGDASVQLQVLLKTKAPAMAIHKLTRSDQDQRDFLRVACGVLKAVDAGAFYPIKGWQCRSCVFAGPCLAG
ncbi:MAG TPA: PD-(D/E)XK nuclease family protein [Myxococcota bacterium]|nr:PD-(D/E)XK nuclease family protein [Myxococcota bacterium]HRY93566.1 PD-(D/E)XK nuclease family protein [Myxococcota bacterium]